MHWYKRVYIAKTGSTVTGVTTTIQTIPIIRNGIKINIIDTPGFGDLEPITLSR